MLTCRACGVEPLAWLRHALTELPQRPENVAIDDLLPFNFAKAQQPDQTRYRSQFEGHPSKAPASTCRESSAYDRSISWS
ncbi:transposase domain-containing protein [Mesorhizobium sp. M0976]|uniref:transposase domain-containing protein n=1 Tax=Mesorhizobium sp. M0976 TaxID=2957038 RepID=UPI0033357B74